jgi:hypothetical protein
VVVDKKQALNSFWSSFGLIAYDETSVPDIAEMPYLTYEVMVSNFGYPISMSANLWYRSTSWRDIVAKEKEISDYISRGGRYIDFDGGSIYIARAENWSTQMSDASDDMIRRILLNVNVEFIDSKEN